jgi:NAD(P)-dependent dehydrogenase (short-subunit alcohol dehydrogenase family)
VSVFVEGLFAGKTAFFTGGTSGIGLGIAERFAELGARVVLVGRNEEKMAGAVEGLLARGLRASGHACDVRQYGAIEEALQQTYAEHGPLDFVFAGAAGNFPAAVTGMSSNGFKAVMDIDVLGTFHTYRAAYSRLRKPGAVLVSISANHAHQPFAMQAHVCAAKAGVELLTQTLALEWGAEGVRTVCITPGPIDETEGMRRLAPTEEARRTVCEHTPLGRLGTKREVADLAVFLCSDAAAYITGAVFRCDGGTGLTGPRMLEAKDGPRLS